MDRNDLIKALGNAFTEPKAGDDSRTVESATAGEKDVLRLLTNYENTSEKNLYQNHPEAHMVSQLVNVLVSSGKNDVAIVGRELIVKFNQAVTNNDEAKIAEIVATCSESYYSLQRFSNNSPEKALLYMTVIDKIKQM